MELMKRLKYLKHLIARTLRRHPKIAVTAGIVIVVGVTGASIAVFRHTATPPTTDTTNGAAGKAEPAPDGSGADASAGSGSQATPKNTPDTPKSKSAAGTSGGSAQGSSQSSGGDTSGGTTGGGTSSPPLVCAALPAFPDENCTGYAHTGVTLHACAAPLTQPSYDSCLFTGEVNVSAANVKITRSKIVGYVSYRTADNGSLRGLSLTDVEIDSTDYQGGATIGNNDYSCVRCNVHGGTRGLNVGYNVTIKDSYSHGWNSRPGDHITGIGSNGGAHNVIDHNNISCDILNDASGFACSSGLSVYGDDAPGNDDWTITDNLINSASSYCMIIAGPPSKPYPFTNVVVTGNHFGNMGARINNVPDSQCTEFGPVNQPGGGVHDWNSGTTNTWSGNVDSDGNAVVAPS